MIHDDRVLLPGSCRGNVVFQVSIGIGYDGATGKFIQQSSLEKSIKFDYDRCDGSCSAKVKF